MREFFDSAAFDAKATVEFLASIRSQQRFYPAEPPSQGYLQRLARFAIEQNARGPSHAFSLLARSSPIHLKKPTLK